MFPVEKGFASLTAKVDLLLQSNKSLTEQISTLTTKMEQRDSMFEIMLKVMNLKDDHRVQINSAIDNLVQNYQQDFSNEVETKQEIDADSCDDKCDEFCDFDIINMIKKRKLELSNEITTEPPPQAQQQAQPQQQQAQQQHINELDASGAIAVAQQPQAERARCEAPLERARCEAPLERARCEAPLERARCEAPLGEAPLGEAPSPLLAKIPINKYTKIKPMERERVQKILFLHAKKIICVEQLAANPKADLNSEEIANAIINKANELEQIWLNS